MKYFSAFFLAGMLAGCQHTSKPSYALEDAIASPYHLSQQVYKIKDLPSPNSNNLASGYVSIALPFAPVNSLKKQIEKIQGLKLKDRGEAHITVLSPPEIQKLKRHLSDGQIIESLDTKSLQNEVFLVQCLGSGESLNLEKPSKTFFIVVRSTGLLSRRKSLEDLYISSGGKKQDFEASRFYPHITIGFTDRDLHEQDGIIKNQKSCFEQIEIDE